MPWTPRTLEDGNAHHLVMVPGDSILEYNPISQNLFCFESKKGEKIAKRKTNFHELKLMVKIWANNMSFPIYSVVGYVQFALNVASYLLFKTSPLSNDADVDII